MERENFTPMTIVPQKNPGDGENRFPNYSQERVELLKQVDESLQKLGKTCGNVSLKMGKFGITQFTLHKFTIVVEVTGDFLRVYTLLHRTTKRDSNEMRFSLLQSAMELNYLQMKTFGACISMDPCPAAKGELEITFSHQFSLLGLTCRDFVRIMLNFMQCTKDLYTHLMTKVGMPVEMDVVVEQQVSRQQQRRNDQASKMWVTYPPDHPRDVKVIYAKEDEEKPMNIQEQMKMAQTVDNEEEEPALLDARGLDYSPPEFMKKNFTNDRLDSEEIQQQQVVQDNKIVDNRNNNEIQLLADEMEAYTSFDQLQDLNTVLPNERSKIVTPQHEAKRKVETVETRQTRDDIIKPTRVEPKTFESAIPRLQQHTPRSPSPALPAQPQRRKIVTPKGYSRRYGDG